MPIKPERASLYGPNWRAISIKIRERDGQRCCFCGVGNARWIQRLERDKKQFVYSSEEAAAMLGYCRPIKIVLTVAHMDREPSNNDPENLKALCQRCHLTYDMEDNRRTAQETRAKKRAAARANERDLFKIGLRDDGY